MRESILSIKLKEYREEHNLTQRELAEYLDVSDKSISKWELGQTYPNKTNILQISKKLSISVETLLLDEMAEDRPKEPEKNRQKWLWFLIVALATFCVLTSVILKQQNKLQLQSKKITKLTTAINLDEQQINSYRVSVVMDLEAGAPELTTFKRYMTESFAVSEFNEMPTETEKGRKIMIMTFIIQAKNNELMGDYHHQIKEQIPNYLNMESHYI